ARVSDASASLLDVLPTLGTGEAVAFGEGVALPTRIRFDRLRPDAMPRSTTARFSQVWQNEVGSRDFMQDVVARWRAHSSGVMPPDPGAETDLPSHDGESDLPVPEPQPAPPPARADPAPAAQAPRKPDPRPRTGVPRPPGSPDKAFTAMAERRGPVLPPADQADLCDAGANGSDDRKKTEKTGNTNRLTYRPIV
ncbi:MAG: hypothetical protein ACR2PM_18395, partial [Hyphomicrobiales bacterium]